MGDGYWLNPNTNQAWQVTRHELWILEPKNAQHTGIPEVVLQRLRTLNPAKFMDEIRMAGVNAGLVRIRWHSNHISVQFASLVNQTEQVMRSLFTFLDGLENYKDTPVEIGNFATGESKTIRLKEIGIQFRLT